MKEQETCSKTTIIKRFFNDMDHNYQIIVFKYQTNEKFFKYVINEKLYINPIQHQSQSLQAPWNIFHGAW